MSSAEWALVSFDRLRRRSARPSLQQHADFPLITFNELNSGSLKRALELENGRKITSQFTVVLFDPLQGREADPRALGELALTPTQ